jgi:protein-disulfide isomerase
MASGKQSKRRRAVQAPKSRSGRAAPQSGRPVQAPKVRAPQQQRRRRQASPRVLIAAAAVVVLAAVGIGLGVALGGGSGPAKPLKNVAGATSLFNGIPQHGNTLGKASAPVTFVEYVDLQCPYCDAFERQVFPDLVRRYVRTGKVKVVIRPLAFIGPDSRRGRDAVIAAGQQGRFFQLMELLYYNQGTENTGWLSESIVKRAATAVGLDLKAFDAARNSAGVSSAAGAFDQLATSQGVRSTPTVFVGKTGGTPTLVQLASPTDEASVVSAIERASA